MAEARVTRVMTPGHRLGWWMGLLLGVLLLTPHDRGWGQTPATIFAKHPPEWRSPLGMDFVLIPAGSFTMGSATGYDDEKPPHRVTISTAFYLGKYEVTQGQGQAVMGTNPSHFTGDPNLPVDNVSWDDVQGFIGKLNAREGGTRYRLPSEAQWEYSARAGSPTAYSFGDDPQQLGDYAWHGGNAGDKTHPVGHKRANAWGLHDMHGNVWEWVQDWFGAYASVQCLIR